MGDGEGALLLGSKVRERAVVSSLLRLLAVEDVKMVH